MEVTFAPRGILQIDNARIIYRNFSGEGSKFNREGDRNFAVRLFDMDLVDKLQAAGWNVKVKPPKEEGDDPFMYLPVKVKFNDLGPHCHLISGNAKIKLDESRIGMLDRIEIASVDLDVRPYDWEVNGKNGRTAYLQSIQVTQNITDRFAEEEYSEE